MDLNPETVFFIIDKAQAFQVKEEATVDEELQVLSDESPRQVLMDDADDPAFQELKTTIDDLEPDQQITLVALMWTGRGDYPVDEWGKAIDLAGERWNERSAEYLIGTPLLADYLRMGLEELGYTRG
jgi:hypothetical protein